MATEHKDVSPASAGGAPAPDPNAVDNALADTLIDQYGFLPLSVRFSAAAAARAVTESWTRSRPVPNAEILPAERKPVLGEPGVDTVTLRRGRRYGEEAIQAMLPQIRRVGQKGQPGLELNWYDMAANAFSTVWSYCEAQTQTDPRDAEIERLRVQFDGIRGALRAANILIEGTRSERDQARAEVEELEQISFTAYAELLNPIKKVFGESPVAASHYRELREGIDGLIGKIEHWQGLAETRGAQVEEFARAIRELTNERDRLRGELDGQRADKEQAEAAHDRLRTRLDQHLADENSAQAANDRLRAALANAEAYRDIAQANERDLRRRLKRIAQETSFESALPDTDGEVPF